MPELTQDLASEAKIAGQETEDLRLNDYTGDYLRRFAEEFPNASPEDRKKYLALSVEFARKQILIEDSGDTDKLTDLPNRKGLHKNLDRKLQQYYRDLKKGKSNMASILYLDLDDFKLVNELYKHKTGDLVLSAFSQLLQTSTRPADLIGRVGGEEFVILLDDTPLEKAIKTADRIRSGSTDLFNQLFPDLKWPKTVSCGIYQLPAMTPTQLASEEGRIGLIEQSIHQADIAQYNGAKHAGKNRIGVMLPDGQIQTAVVNLSPGTKFSTVSYQEPVLV